jgi:hypothetical protein
MEYVGGYEPDWLLKRDADIVRVKVRPASLQINMQVAGYIAPMVVFHDVLPDGSTFITDVVIALHMMHAQVAQAIEAFESLF